MTARKSISTTKRTNLFFRKGGICHLCGLRVQAGEAWDLSHVTPLEMGGADDETNWDVAHRKCHRAHTAKVDVPIIAKAKRREAKFIGAHRSSRPMPGSRASKWKQKLTGEWVRR